ncbi:hypothetical protein MsAm2_10370 [Methanolapillus ohkumae]|uniref:Uncharacterized protein n=1 Tax=Methanolapillus ohkumae TaxID=3028298 RepID=A0AA96ZVT7_9EURY|nr:hypothetical protein MsAm2_10370 [Methanosarcinaceae archaeon Am2]
MRICQNRLVKIGLSKNDEMSELVIFDFVIFAKRRIVLHNIGYIDLYRI